MTTAIIGVGRIGSALARDRIRGGERVVLATRQPGQIQALAAELGASASSAAGASGIRQPAATAAT